jgi:hypothetical protein
MSTGNTMVLFNGLPKPIGPYFFITTNSGVDSGVCAGKSLEDKQQSSTYSFNIDGGKTDYWSLVVEYAGQFYTSSAEEANLVDWH